MVDKGKTRVKPKGSDPRIHRQTHCVNKYFLQYKIRIVMPGRKVCVRTNGVVSIKHLVGGLS